MKSIAALALFVAEIVGATLVRTIVQGAPFVIAAYVVLFFVK